MVFFSNSIRGKAVSIHTAALTVVNRGKKKVIFYC